MVAVNWLAECVYVGCLVEQSIAIESSVLIRVRLY